MRGAERVPEDGCGCGFSMAGGNRNLQHVALTLDLETYQRLEK